MTDAVETMAWSEHAGVPWHGLGDKVSNDLTPDEMLVKAGIPWTVSKQPLYVERDGDYKKLAGMFELKRNSDNSTLSVVGATYKPVQNRDAMEFFTEYVKAGKMKMETAGSLHNGRYIWGLARVNKDFQVGKGDKVQNYLLMCQPHVRGKAMIFQYTSICVVCWNTLTYAIGADLKGDKSKGVPSWRMPHSMKFDDAAKESAREALGLVEKKSDEFKEASTQMAKRKLSEEGAREYFCNVLKFDPAQAATKKDGDIKVPRLLPHFETALTEAWGQNLITRKGTVWGAFNAVTAVIDHQHGRDRQTSLRNAWLGHTAGIKRRAFKLAIELAK